MTTAIYPRTVSSQLEAIRNHAPDIVLRACHAARQVSINRFHAVENVEIPLIGPMQYFPVSGELQLEEGLVSQFQARILCELRDETVYLRCADLVVGRPEYASLSEGELQYPEAPAPAPRGRQAVAPTQPAARPVSGWVNGAERRGRKLVLGSV